MKLLLDSFSYHLRLGKHEFKPTRISAGLAWVFTRTCELGLDGVQIDPMHVDSWEPEALENVRIFCKARGLVAELGMGGCDPEKFHERIRAAKIMGARTIRTFVGSERPDEDNLEDFKAYAVSGLSAVAREAEKAGVRIGLENHGDFLAEEVREILEQVGSKAIGACIDTGNNLFLGQDSLHVVRTLAPFAVSVHLKDAVQQPAAEEEDRPDFKYVPFGDGDVPLREIIEILREQETGTNICIEMVAPVLESESETLAYEDQCVRESIKFARESLGL